MARFQYRLQNILSMKGKLEVLAKQEFSAAQQAYQKARETLDLWIGRKEGLEAELEDLLGVGAMDLSRIGETSLQLRYVEKTIVEQREIVAKARRVLEEATERLTEVRKERKTYEILKEKEYEEYRKEENRQESQEINELVSFTYGRRKANGNGR
ncbi:MAG: flagellar export protein FliJ [Clostridium sp.]|jgi:flagellar FliJ protein|nr:flagellar export protein FliJ [Clostridium sp.]